MKKCNTHFSKTCGFLILLAAVLAFAGCTTRTPLIRAVENRDMAGINRLLDAGHNINEPSTGKWSASPLYWATYFCMADAAELLLKRGASTSVPGPNGGGTLLTTATACSDNMAPVVRLLVEKGENVNVQDAYYGYTPLMSAALNNYLEIANALVKGGADPGLKSREGKTALDYARYYNNREVIALLNPGDPSLHEQAGARQESIAELQKAASAGDAAAQYQLGVAYQNGDGVERNADEAAKWFRMSAESKMGKTVAAVPPAVAVSRTARRSEAAAVVAKAAPVPESPALAVPADKPDLAENDESSDPEPDKDSGPKDSTPKAAPPRQAHKNIPPSGYTLEAEPMVLSMIRGEFAVALSHADQSYKMLQEPRGLKQNHHLLLLERGKVALAVRKYDRSIADLQEAEKRFLTIEGTISIAEGFGSLATDDTGMEYEPEMHEKLMISPYLVLAYLGKGDFDGARVERNRTIHKIHQYIEEKPERAYLENPFARLLSAVVYEMEGKYDDAKIEYRKMKRTDEIRRLENRKEETSDLVVVIDAGMAPQKYEVKWGPAPVPTGMDTVTLGFTYAAYNPSHGDVPRCNVMIGKNPANEAKILYDLEDTILAQYEKNKAGVTAKIVARMTAKAAAQVAAQYAAKRLAGNIPFAGLFLSAAVSVASAQWIASEKADLRSWVTLPKQVQYLRLNDLGPGEHRVSVDCSGRSQAHSVKVEKGKLGVVYFAAPM